MYPELRVPVQVDDIKLHLKSVSFDLREKNGGLIRVVQECELLTTSCLSRKVTIEAKTSLELQGLRLQCFCDEQELGIDSGIDPFCKLAAAGG